MLFNRDITFRLGHPARTTVGHRTTIIRLIAARYRTGAPCRSDSRCPIGVTPHRTYATLVGMGGRSSVHRVHSLIGVGEGRRRPLERKARRGGGRPSRAEALQLRERILDVAAELFLTQGYGTTSIEAVAARAGISKRTFYHRFDDKAALFSAVVHRIIAQIRPPPAVPLLEGRTLQGILRRLARLILRAALTPQAIALHRLITAESARFPNLARAVYDQGWAEATALIGDLLARELRSARLTRELRRFAAVQFVHLVVTAPQRRIIGLGASMTPRQLETWADNSVKLFLGGCRELSRQLGA
jgi:TetR/AcrR family transcriptional regulator, mexJK operon transcriptional repressor